MKKIFVTMAKKQCNTMIFTTNKLTINHRGGIENVLLYRTLFGHIHHYSSTDDGLYEQKAFSKVKLVFIKPL